jgi:hypothetical protein
MLARLGFMAWLALATPQDTRAPAAELLPLAERVKLRTLAGEIARCGDVDLIARMRAVLARLGDAPDELEDLEDGWQRSAASARPSRSLRPALANKLRKSVEPLAERLATTDEPAKSALARALLALDADEPSANAVLGRERDRDGVWRTAEELHWAEGARAVAASLHSAATLDFEIERGKSANATLRAVCGGGSFVRAGGLELHSALPDEALERILRQALRAADLSRTLLGAPAAQKSALRRFVLMQARKELEGAVDEAGETGGLDPESSRRVRDLHLESFYDDRGWETVGWRSEAEFAALLLWRKQEDWIPSDAQPCLRVGHVNWVCLRFLGTHLPTLAWLEEAPGGVHANATSAVTARRDAARERRWRCARESLFGCRAWMLERARTGADPSWARTMLDQDGKIHGEELLKTTLVCEMLQEEGRLGPVIAASLGAQDPVRRIETALGQSMPELEQRWRRWIDPAEGRGVVQALQAEPPQKASASPTQGLLDALDEVRASALGLGTERLRLDAELSSAAEQHASYLVRNPSQRGHWPEIHEELANAPGFSAAGALTGSRALIAFGNDPAEVVPAWLGTYYHRLPLLWPGLFGVGFGRCEDVIVLDTGSLVASPDHDQVVLWPLPGATGVPRRFVPELPNPVPEADMTTLGYPVTMQLARITSDEDVRVQLELFAERIDGERVEGHRLAPDSPLPLAPRNAWGWIPSRPLGSRARYAARARWGDQERVWSFTTGE